MTDHPLTDEILFEKFNGVYHGNRHFDTDDMRAAADWQLEQVIKYLENDLEFVLWSDNFMNKFRKAMRPQKQEDN